MLFSSFDTQMMEIIPRVGLSHIFYANVAISRHISRHPANCNVSRHPAHATISSHHDNACVFSHQWRNSRFFYCDYNILSKKLRSRKNSTRIPWIWSNGRFWSLIVVIDRRKRPQEGGPPPWYFTEQSIDTWVLVHVFTISHCNDQTTNRVEQTIMLSHFPHSMSVHSNLALPGENQLGGGGWSGVGWDFDGLSS